MLASLIWVGGQDVRRYRAIHSHGGKVRERFPEKSLYQHNWDIKQRTRMNDKDEIDC